MTQTGNIKFIHSVCMYWEPACIIPILLLVLLCLLVPGIIPGSRDTVVDKTGKNSSYNGTYILVGKQR